jgi:hypothetical protein
MLVVMQRWLPKTQRRRAGIHFRGPAILQWLGIAIVVVVVFWTMAMVFMQAWQSLQPRAK